MNFLMCQNCGGGLNFHSSEKRKNGLVWEHYYCPICGWEESCPEMGWPKYLELKEQKKSQDILNGVFCTNCGEESVVFPGRETACENCGKIIK